MPLTDPQDHHRRVHQIARLLDSAHHDRRGAVRLHTTVEQPKRFRDHRRREVTLHREFPVAHQCLRMMLGVRAERQRNLAQVSGQCAVELLMAGRDPTVELHRGTRPVRKVKIDDNVRHRVGVHPSLGQPCPRPRSKRRVSVPPDHDQHIVRDATRHGHRRTLQRSHRRRPTHMHRRGVRHRFDTQVRGKLLDRRVTRRRHHAIDVGHREPRVRNGLAGDVQHHLHRQLVGAAQVIGLCHTNNRGATAQSGHSWTTSNSTAYSTPTTAPNRCALPRKKTSGSDIPSPPSPSRYAA